MICAHDQLGLFGSGPSAPEGFRYATDVLPPALETELLRRFEELPFREFEFHGYLGKRRVVSFGWRYDFSESELQKVDDIPPFLFPLRQRAAEFAGLSRADLQHALITEYGPGAAIGWHRDKAVFDEVVGISLLSACRFRFRRRVAGKWQRAAIMAEPRSAYLLAGASRTEWEHSIPAVEQLRYSITFRNFRPRT